RADLLAIGHGEEPPDLVVAAVRGLHRRLEEEPEVLGGNGVGPELPDRALGEHGFADGHQQALRAHGGPASAWFGCRARATGRRRATGPRGSIRGARPPAKPAQPRGRTPGAVPPSSDWCHVLSSGPASAGRESGRTSAISGDWDVRTRGTQPATERIESRE